jgi:hypothetical protein
VNVMTRKRRGASALLDDERLSAVVATALHWSVLLLTSAQRRTEALATRAELRRRAASLAHDPSFRVWASGVRHEITRGIDPMELIGADELRERKAAVRSHG